MTRKSRDQQNLDYKSTMESRKMNPNAITNFLSSDERKILSAFPIFGGTSPEGNGGSDSGSGSGSDSGSGSEPKVEVKTTTTAPPKTEENPLEKLQKDPIALQQLLDQVNKTQSDLQKITGERDTLQSEKDRQARSQLTKEENLTKDLETAQAQIEKLTNVIHSVALNNAFLESSGEMQWNSVKQAMAELNPDNYTIEVDVENGKATVTGIENEVKRIAKDFSWLVKNAANDQNNNGHRGPGRPRSTGAPPAGPGGSGGGDKSARRNEMMNRFPVLMQGR